MKQLVKDVLEYFGVGIHPRFRKPLVGKNSIVERVISNYKLKMNRLHIIEFMQKHNPEYNKHLPRIVKAVALKYPKLTVVDIGANIGDTAAYILDTVKVPIICIEGSDLYFDILNDNIKQFQNVTAYKTFLGESDKQKGASIETKIGTAIIKVNEHNDESGSIQLDTFDQFLQKNNIDAQNIKCIKIDTDGFDVKILRGSTEHLKIVKPVLFIEYDMVLMKQVNEDGVSTLKMLNDLGYSDVMFYDNLGRFIVALKLDNVDSIQQMTNYICGYKGRFTFYDLCIFHKDDADLAQRFIRDEMMLSCN